SLEPEGAYLAWTIKLTTEADEASVREVFEFVEFDCDLTVGAGAPARIMAEQDVEQTVISVLAQVAAEEAADAVALAAMPAPVAPVEIAEVPAPVIAASAPAASVNQQQANAQ